MPEITCDGLFNGRLAVCQHRTGYRFSIDAVLLAHHPQPRPGQRVVDLGCGCGILPLILAYRHPGLELHGVEVQPRLAELARGNAQRNGFGSVIRIHSLDLRDFTWAASHGPVDLVLSNPPYRQNASGRLNPDEEKAVARHELAITLAELLMTASRLLRKGGEFWIVYPTERLADLVCGLRGVGLEPKQLRLVHSHAASEAQRLVLGAVRGARPGMRVGAPLCIYDGSGAYTPEVARMLAP